MDSAGSKLTPDTVRRKNWQREYSRLKGIRLEFNRAIPPAVSLFQKYLNHRTQINRSLRILDIGCGKGRIALHLAQHGHRVTGFDFAPSALTAMRTQAKKLRVSSRVSIHRQDANQRWPVRAASQDAAFAITVIDNLLSSPQQLHFRRELTRILKPRGIVTLEWFTRKDGYYGPLLRNSPDRRKKILYDPHNNITFRLYDLRAVSTLLGPAFLPIRHKQYCGESIKYNARYRRNSCIAVYQKIL